MKYVLATGQLYADRDGEIFEVIKATKSKLVLESSEGHQLEAVPEEFIEDLEAGYFEDLDDAEGASQ